ncbi:hypothetical protein J7394_09055, partial [Ruegeria sp. R13_0]|uniref:hypothetical protein n=1 Tax=Ruegeria sp. R13_0 TaxID=2821099 RepID=UPI001ADB567B
TDIQSVETNQTAHISLQLSINVKEHNTQSQKPDRCANPSARPANHLPKMPTASPMRPTVSPVRLTVSPVRLQRLSSAGEGVFTD